MVSKVMTFIISFMLLLYVLPKFAFLFYVVEKSGIKDAAFVKVLCKFHDTTVKGATLLPLLKSVCLPR